MKEHIKMSLQRCPSLINLPEILDTLVTLYKNVKPDIKKYVYDLILYLPIANPHLDLVHFHLEALRDNDFQIRQTAVNALCNISEDAVTNEIINGLADTLNYINPYDIHCVCKVLGKTGQEAVTKEVIIGIRNARIYDEYYIRKSAFETL